MVLKKLICRFEAGVKAALKLIKCTSDNDKDDCGGDTSTLFLEILPNDVWVNILSRLDLVTLCHCATASTRFALLLPQIHHLATTLPSSVILSSKPSSWYGLIARYVYTQVMRQNNILFKVLPRRMLWSFTTRIWSPRFSQPASQFLRRLTGLKSLEIELKTPDYFNAPNSSFRWLGEYEPWRNCFLCLDSTIIPQNQVTLAPLSRSTVLRQYENIVRRSYYHKSAGYPFSSRKWPNKLQTILVKDDCMNGRQIYRSKSRSNSVLNNEAGFYMRRFCCYLTTISVPNNESPYIVNSIIYCTYWGKDIDKDITPDEFVRTLLRNTRDCEQERELAQVVQNMLQHEKLVVIEDAIRDYQKDRSRVPDYFGILLNLLVAVIGTSTLAIHARGVYCRR